MQQREQNEFFVWAVNHAKAHGACQEYRLKGPQRWLDKLGLAYCYEDQGENGTDDTQAMLTADVDLFYSVAGEGYLHKMRTIRAMRPAPRPDGTLHFPPAVVYDCDDNADFVHPFNSTFVHLGVRAYPDASLLTPGEILAYTDASGQEHVLWDDGVTVNKGLTFSIAGNLHQMKIRHTIIREAHGATVSTPALASYFRDVLGQPNVYVFPNTLDPEEYEHYDVVRKDPDTIRVLWQGGMSHYVDWYPLREAVQAVTAKYPQLKWVIYGEKFNWITDIIPEKQLEFHYWTNFDAFKIKRGILNIDINLCPLADNAFNRCKSAIKWYEGSIWERPEATLAAAAGPYLEIQDGHTGLLFRSPDEFAQKLGLLVEDAQLRARLGQEAKRWVLANRTPAVTVPGLMEFYQELRARQRRDHLTVPATQAEIKRLAAREHALR